MTAEIKVKEAKATSQEDIILPKPTTLSGWIGFVRYSGIGVWSLVYPETIGMPDPNKPYPLHKSRQACVEAASKQLPNGGELKLSYMEL